MSDNIVLEQLRLIRGTLDTIGQDVSELKHRMTQVELSVAAIRHDITDVYERQIRQYTKVDALTERVERIERRLDLVGGAS
jgi:predicted  nucleic acid-binding Zn-ribbon protein